MPESGGSPLVPTTIQSLAGKNQTDASVTDDSEVAADRRKGNGASLLSSAVPHGGRARRSVKDVPETAELRQKIRAAADRLVVGLDKSRPFTRDELEGWTRQLLNQLQLPERYLGFAAVCVSNAFWRPRFLSVPFRRRMLLLPRCLKHPEKCDPTGNGQLNCQDCGECVIGEFKVRAERLGYRVLVADGTPVVMKVVVAGYADAVLGVACLNVLEKALDKVLLAGVPAYAVPLHYNNCKNTSLDEGWVWEVLDKHEATDGEQAANYVDLLRVANSLFEEHFDRLLPRHRTAKGARCSPWIAKTEEIAYDWLMRGGKRFRPFITLAAYQARCGCALKAASNNGHTCFPDAVCRVAMAIEAFHKASLVHDDIEDDDLYRYGRETLHRRYGVPTAINVGDYLIGLGYRLVNAASRELGPDVACDVLDRMSTAHIRLCDGQGAEMSWQAAPTLDFSPLEALQIYTLKTAPAFEAALYAGLRMAGPIDEYDELIHEFSRHLGIGFQILNDLKDWYGDENNKLVAGQDAAALRPTVLLALAAERADESQRRELHEMLSDSISDEARIVRLRRIFCQCGAFEMAEKLVEKSRQRALALARDAEPAAVRHLLHFLVETVLAPEHDPQQLQRPVVPLPIATDSE